MNSLSSGVPEPTCRPMLNGKIVVVDDTDMFVVKDEPFAGEAG